MIILAISAIHIQREIIFISAKDVWELWYNQTQQGIITLEYIEEIFEYFRSNPLFVQKTYPDGDFKVQWFACCI
jgi:hypothetical protein